MSEDRPTLVLGTAFGYAVPQVWAFVESLRRVYRGEAGLLVTSRSAPGLIDYLKSRDIRPIYYDSPFWMFAHVQTGRYVRYGEVLRESAVRYDRVLLTDVGDVVFQDHPFRDAPDGQLLFFLEDDRTRIHQCRNNAAWVQDMFGVKGMAKLRDKPISCSGTTIGGHEAILTYIDALLAHAKPEIMARLGGTRGQDQGIHNYILHTRELPGITAVDNGVFVHTLAQVPEAEIAIGAQGIAVAASGKICPIVHQYNYKPSAAAYVQAAFPFKP